MERWNPSVPPPSHGYCAAFPLCGAVLSDVVLNRVEDRFEIETPRGFLPAVNISKRFVVLEPRDDLRYAYVAFLWPNVVTHLGEP
jgi:hypothetical protein